MPTLCIARASFLFLGISVQQIIYLYRKEKLRDLVTLFGYIFLVISLIIFHYITFQ